MRFSTFAITALGLWAIPSPANASPKQGSNNTPKLVSGNIWHIHTTSSVAMCVPTPGDCCTSSRTKGREPTHDCGEEFFTTTKKKKLKRFSYDQPRGRWVADLDGSNAKDRGLMNRLHKRFDRCCLDAGMFACRSAFSTRSGTDSIVRAVTGLASLTDKDELSLRMCKDVEVWQHRQTRQPVQKPTFNV